MQFGLRIISFSRNENGSESPGRGSRDEMRVRRQQYTPLSHTVRGTRGRAYIVRCRPATPAHQSSIT
eukprot:5449064-Prymnesium_polylepis.2